MTIHLSGSREQLVLSLLQGGQFSSADEVIDEALRLVGQRYQGSSAGNGADNRTSRQLETLKRLGEKTDAMPVVDVADGLSGRDHDKIIYSK
jgi:Arc/MetJ-type ribon-helix-helix transcriptional regulator